MKWDIFQPHVSLRRRRASAVRRGVTPRKLAESELQRKSQKRIRRTRHLISSEIPVYSGGGVLMSCLSRRAQNSRMSRAWLPFPLKTALYLRMFKSNLIHIKQPYLTLVPIEDNGSIIFGVVSVFWYDLKWRPYNTKYISLIRKRWTSKRNCTRFCIETINITRSETQIL